ncbi:glutathione peroxidase [Pseudomonas sp. ML96]|uniref:glutathione peroxidase n=1 Tax=Pseudomonas sp. ML96 TaxID=1523503 RepID=UPI0005BD9421|nr:glutathione peroxidase [Pseudomonas sp. ML96]
MLPRIASLSLLCLLSTPLWAADCPPLLKDQGELQQLRSKERIDLCQRFSGKPLLVVNTASHCGFTPQFKGLEALYQRYKGQGLEVLGVPSDDFRQEADNSEGTAKVCFIDYGVTFAMSEPQSVSGSDAAPLFRELAEQSSAPRWNFYKYVVGRDGKVIASFSSLTKPDDEDLIEAIDKAIAQQ